MYSTVILTILASSLISGSIFTWVDKGMKGYLVVSFNVLVSCVILYLILSILCGEGLQRLLIQLDITAVVVNLLNTIWLSFKDYGKVYRLLNRRKNKDVGSDGNHR